MHILVVEDEQYVAEVLCKALETLGNSCLWARDAETATAIVNARS